MKNIIFEQKIEKERLSGGKYVPRDNLRSAKEYLNNDLIKVIIGPRRAGKSVFALQLLADYNFAYINFDDERLLDIDNYDLELSTHLTGRFIELNIFPFSFCEYLRTKNYHYDINKMLWRWRGIYSAH